MDLKNLITSIFTTVTIISKELNDNTEIRSLVCGKYSDGRVRSVSDAMKGEYRSPKERKKLEGGSKKHKKNKYKKKYNKLKKKNKKHNKKQKSYSKKYKYTI